MVAKIGGGIGGKKLVMAKNFGVEFLKEANLSEGHKGFGRFGFGLVPLLRNPILVYNM